MLNQLIINLRPRSVSNRASLRSTHHPTCRWTLDECVHARTQSLVVTGRVAQSHFSVDDQVAGPADVWSHYRQPRCHALLNHLAERLSFSGCDQDVE